MSLQGPFLFVFVHLCRRPPVPHSPACRPSLPLRHPQVVVAGLQTRQRDGRERLVSSRGQRGICFLPWYLGQTLVQTLPLAQHEYINAYGTDSGRETVRHNFDLSADPPSPDPQSAPSPAPAAASDSSPTTE